MTAYHDGGARILDIQLQYPHHRSALVVVQPEDPLGSIAHVFD